MQGYTTLQGKIWMIVDEDNHLINDIDTDMIFHNRYLAITDITQMGQYAFDNLTRWKDFSQKAESGDILIVGKNFGAGSSRQQAVDCFAALGIQAIIAQSFGAIYKRNAINSGLPILTLRSIDVKKLIQRQEISIDLKTGKTSLPAVVIEPLAQVQMDIYQAGNLFAFGKTILS